MQGVGWGLGEKVSKIREGFFSHNYITWAWVAAPEQPPLDIEAKRCDQFLPEKLQRQTGVGGSQSSHNSIN